MLSEIDLKKIILLHVFIALHGMQTRSSDENSVCSSVKRVNCDETEEKSVVPCC